MNGYLQKLILMSAAGVVVGGCVDNDHAPPGGPLVETTATIANQLPVDGCSYPVTINDVDYAPDAASRDLIIARGITSSLSTVTIKYRLTGRTGQVECGFLRHSDLPEISFVFVD